MSHRNDRDPSAPEWARPGFDDPDALEVPRFPSNGPPRQSERHPVGCRCMSCLLLRLRMVLRAETPGAINQHAAPVLRDWDGVVSARDADEGGVGMPMTAAMHRYLSGPDAWGLSRLGMLSIIEVSERCASRHPPHRRPMFTRTQCGQLLFEAAYLGQELVDLVWLHPELELEQISGMLSWGLAHAEDWRAERFARWTKIPGEAEPMPERRPIRPAA